MHKRILLPFLCLILVSEVLFGVAAADYLNDSWIHERSGAFLTGEDHAVPVGSQFRAMRKRLLPDSVQVDSGTVTIGVRPPVNVSIPYVAKTDSMDSGNRAVVRKYEVPGLRVERYQIIPIEEYSAKRLDTNLQSTWRNNEKRFPNWASNERSGAASAADLDFALPVGKRFEHLVGGKSRLDINGSQTITFSGKSEYDEGAVATSATSNSAFPSLSMKQEPQFSIRGSVGERVTVDIKQESGSGFSLGNNLEDNISIKYKGEETDIIQNIEAGNTSLNLEGAQFAGYSGSHKGLFGIRAEGRVGPLKFTAIASQEKSESGKKTFKGTAEESTSQIYDYSYKRNTYFFLDTAYRDNFDKQRTSLDLVTYVSQDSIVTIYVYEDDGNTDNDLNEATLAYRGTAYPMDINGETTGEGISGKFHLLKVDTDYSVNRALGYIMFKTAVPVTSTIGVYMVLKRGNEIGLLDYNADDSNSRMKFKLIKKKSQTATDTDTWDLEWKNVYDLGQTGIAKDGLEVNIYRDTSDGVKPSTQDGVPIIQILGLDKRNDTKNEETPDNKIDLNRALVNYSRGELIFPLLRPFASEHTPDGVTIALTPQVPEIYTKTTNLDQASKYYIEVKTSSGQKTIRIDTMGGITEGTERVTVDGTTLTRGSDYTISYSSGEITFMKAIAPTANLDITYEEQSAMMSMQKSLFGLRTEYDFWSNSHIGGVFLYNNESTTEERVKLGSEPSRTMLFDTDASLNFDAPLLTKAVDALPFVIADQKSTIRFEGELARSLPNMNTKGEVYVDDFEGSQNTPISISRTNWTMGSAPDVTITNGMWMMKRGTLQWYNPWDQVDSKDIWENKETTSEENTVSTFNLSYKQAEETSDPRTSFASIMTPIYGGGQDFSQARFIELWAKGTKGTLKLDLGSISEDWYPLDAPDGEINTEDRPLTGTEDGNGTLDVGEDTGFDGLLDKDEPGYNSATNPDPSGDDWNSDKNDYSHINELEGNSRESGQQILDTEDINSNGNLDTKTSYYEYSIDLSDTTYLVPGTQSKKGWRMFRIPLWNNELALVGGTTPPDSTLIEFMRLVVTNCDTTLIQIANLEIAENSWLEDGIVDSTGTDIPESADDDMRISRINTDDNSKKDNNGNLIKTSGYYYPPPGVKQEIDKTTDVMEMEQSLVIITEDLAPGNTAFAYRSFSTKMDFTNYTSLKMYAHGPDDFPDIVDPSTVELIFRFGADRENYYEYRTPLYKGWEEANDVEANFATCTGLKLERTAVDTTNGRYEKIVGTKTYAIYGSPNLQNVKLISVGIRNRGINNLTSEVWLDELRMDNLRDMTGTAARASIDANLAGFANVAARIEHRTADFHGMNSTTGSGADATSWSTSVSVNLDRFTPKRWNLQLPVKGDMNESSSLPRLKSGSDIILTDAQKKEYKSESFGQNYSVSYRKNADPSQKGITKQLLNWGLEKWNASYSWGEDTGSTPLTGSTTDHQSQGQFTYNVNPSGRSVNLFSWTGIKQPWIAKRLDVFKLGYTPTQLSYDLNYSNKFNLDDETSIGGVADTTETRVMTERINFGYDPLSNILKYQYSQDRKRDLVLSRETDYSETNRLTLAGPRFGYLTNNYNYDVSYREENNRRYASVSSEIGGRDVALQKRFSADASLEWGRLFEKLGRDSGGTKASPTPGTKRGDPGKEPPKNGAPKTGLPSKGGAKKPEPQKANGIGLRAKIFRAISKTVSPLGFRYSKNERFDFESKRDRPDFGSRFGFGTIDPDTSTVVVLDNSQSNSSSVSLETNLKLPMNMGLSTSMDMSSQNSASNSSSSRSEEATLPDLDFSWNNIDNQLQFLKKYMTNISMTSRFSLKNAKAWDDGSAAPTSDRTTRSHSPLISLNGIAYGGVQSSMSISMSSEESNTLSGKTASTTINDKLDMNATFRYNVSPTSGFLRKIKVKSSVDLQVTLGANQSEQRRSTNGSAMSVIAKSSSWSFSPKADYRFSQKFTGSAMVNVQNSKNLAGTVHKVREVSISGKMTF